MIEGPDVAGDTSPMGEEARADPLASSQVSEMIAVTVFRDGCVGSDPVGYADGEETDALWLTLRLAGEDSRPRSRETEPRTVMAVPDDILIEGDATGVLRLR